MLERRIEVIKTFAGHSRRAPSAGRRGRPGGLRRRPGPGEWAVIEVVAHLADTEERALARVRRMLAEDNPHLEPFDQEALAVQRHYLDQIARLLSPAWRCPPRRSCPPTLLLPRAKDQTILI
jgi:DinB superfamily